MPDHNKIEIQGPEASILAVYIEEVTKQSPYGFVTDLLDAARAFCGEEGKFSVEATRMRVRRYKKEHPQTFAKIEELVKTYLTNAAANPGPQEEFARIMYEGVYDPKIKDVICRP